MSPEQIAEAWRVIEQPMPCDFAAYADFITAARVGWRAALDEVELWQRSWETICVERNALRAVAEAAEKVMSSEVTQSAPFFSYSEAHLNLQEAINAWRGEK